VDDFYAARSRTIPPLPWSNFAPPISVATLRGSEYGWLNYQTDSKLSENTMKLGEPNKENTDRAGIVTPFVREQVRWALSRYRSNHKIGVPTLRDNIISAVGDEHDTELTAQDIYNFLDNGKQTRAHKIRLMLRFLRVAQPDYVSALNVHQLGLQAADLLAAYSSGFGTQPKKARSVDDILAVFDQKTFFTAVKVGSIDDAWMEPGHQWDFHGIDVRFMAFRYPGAGDHLIFHRFSIYFQNLPNGGDDFVHTNDERQKPDFFTIDQFVRLLELLSNFDFSLDVPIENKEHGVIVGAPTIYNSSERRDHILLVRGVEPGLRFEACEVIETVSNPLVDGPCINISDVVSNRRRTASFSQSEAKIPFLDLGIFPPPSEWKNQGFSGNNYTISFPVKNRSLDSFIDGFNWGDL